MKIFRIKILLLLFLQLSKSVENHENLIEFLVDFFGNRNVTIVANICWPFDAIKNLSTQMFTASSPKQLVINTNFSNEALLDRLQFDDFNIIDISCPEAKNLLSKVDKRGLFKSPHKWVLIQSVNPDLDASVNTPLISNDVYEDLLKDFKVLLDSEVYGAISYKDTFYVFLYYKIQDNITIVRENYSKWSKKNGSTIQLSSNITSFRRKDFQYAKIRLTIVILNNDSLSHLEDFRDPVIDMISKASFGIVKCLLQYVNGSYSLLPALNWGYKTKTGDILGMVGHLKNDEADISVSGMVFIKERAEVVEFIKMIVPTGVFFFFRKPPLSYVQNIFTLPFRWTLWVSMIILVITVTLLLYFSVSLENRHRRQGERSIVFGDIAIIALSAVCLQGIPVEPRSFHGRTITFFLFTALMFLYTAYSANIVALLQSTTNDIVTLEDLLRSRIKCGAEDIIYNRYFFENAKERIRTALYREKIGQSGFYNATEGVMRIKKGLFAFHIEKGPGYYYLLKYLDESEKCELQEIGGYIQGSLHTTWVAIQQKSPYKEIFKIGLLKIDEYGLQKRFLERFYKKPQCSQSASSFTSVGIVDFYPALIVYVFGVSLAITVFTCEITLNKYIERKQST